MLTPPRQDQVAARPSGREYRLSERHVFRCEDHRVSYDLAVWGRAACGDAAAGETFHELYARYIDSDDLQPPSDRIRGYALALLDWYPDIGDDAGVVSPWSAGPLIGEAVGPLMYFPKVWSRCEEVSACAAGLAAEHGLVCYDPQLGRLRP